MDFQAILPKLVTNFRNSAYQCVRVSRNPPMTWRFRFLGNKIRST